VKTLVRLPPTAVSAVTITTAIRAAIRPYSIAVAPSSFFIKFVNSVNILNSPMWLFGNNTKEKLQNTYPEIARLSPGGLLVSHLGHLGRRDMLRVRDGAQSGCRQSDSLRRHK